MVAFLQAERSTIDLEMTAKLLAC